MTRRFTAMALSVIALSSCACAAGTNVVLRDRWVSTFCNMASDEQVATQIARMEEAARLGYNGIWLNDSKWVKWDRLDDYGGGANYLANLAKVRETARRLNLKVMAVVAPIGYSNDLLQRDRSLAEGLPAEKIPFVVRNGALEPVPEPLVVNGGFETSSAAQRVDGWTLDDRGGCFVDHEVRHEGEAALRIEARGGRMRISQSIATTPWRYYVLSVWMKAVDMSGREVVSISPLGKDGRLLNWQRVQADKDTFGLKATQEWVRVVHAFNTLGNDSVTLHLGTWAEKRGTLWLDDVRIEPAGLCNVLRRDGCPLVLTSLDGATVYEEGRDVAPVVDPKLGEPYTWHEPPTVRILAGGRLKEGDRLLVSYYHPAVTAWGQVTCCMNAPKMKEILKWHFEQVHKHVQPDAYLLSHDEVRVQGWDQSCRAAGSTGGEMLADNIGWCIDALRKEDPGKPLWVFNDLFDPHHNAGRELYHLVAGTNGWWGSWEGLPKDVGVFNWLNIDDDARRLASLRFFSERGYRQQLCGYYDVPHEKVAPGFARWWKDVRTLGARVDGVVYCTFENKWLEMGHFLRSAEDAAAAPVDPTVD